jgi:hypothetical protein
MCTKLKRGSSYEHGAWFVADPIQSECGVFGKADRLDFCLSGDPVTSSHWFVELMDARSPHRSSKLEGDKEGIRSSGEDDGQLRIGAKPVRMFLNVCKSLLVAHCLCTTSSLKSMILIAVLFVV